MNTQLFNKDTVALVVIDLQKGIVGNRTLAPHTSDIVVSNAAKLADTCRKKNIPVMLVHVKPTPATSLKVDSDTSVQFKTPPSVDWAEFVTEIGSKETDVIITKQQWGAFYGTDLDLQLRRRNIDTIILCGISTNIGVESTARDAYELGFKQVFAEDAMTAMTTEEHLNTINHIFKRIGRVRSTKDILEQLTNN